MAIEIVDFPMNNGWIFPWQNVAVHQRVYGMDEESKFLCLVTLGNRGNPA